MSALDAGAMIAAVQKRLQMLDWTITFSWCTPEALDKIIPGAMAICDPMPTRSLAHIMLRQPWPANEDLQETIAHEITHALISPLTSLIQRSDAAVMLEEGIVEKIGIALRSSPDAPYMGRAIARAVARYAPRMRARISALASRRARKDSGMVDPSLKQKALDALLGDDMEALKEIVKALITDDGEPGGDEVPPPARADGGDGGPPGDGQPPPARSYGREDDGPAARKARLAATNAETARARRAADEIEVMRLDLLGDRKGEIVASLRARMPGHSGLASVEKKIAAAKTYAAAKEIADIAVEMGGGGQRARSGVQLDGTPPTGEGAPPVTDADLAREGFDPRFVADYKAEHRSDPASAAAMLDSGRVAMARVRARKASAAGKGGN